MTIAQEVVPLPGRSVEFSATDAVVHLMLQFLKADWQKPGLPYTLGPLF